MNVLLVRVDGIGDALACTPLVAALRDAGHTVSALLSTRNRHAFAPRAFERVHVVERIPWPRHGTTPESRRTALTDARAARYDVALVASEEVDAYAFARDARIATRVGFTTGWAKPLKSLQVARLTTRRAPRDASARDAREHEVETLFRLGAGLHDERAPTRDLTRLRPLVFDDPVVPHGRVVVQATPKLAPSGLDAEAYGTLVRVLSRAFGDVVVLGDDRTFTARVGRAAGLAVEMPATVAAWKRHIAGAIALVTPDSGAAHVAGMAGVPCVDLFPASRATPHDVVRWKPWAAPSRALVVAGSDAAALAARVASALEELVAGRPFA